MCVFEEIEVVVVPPPVGQDSKKGGMRRLGMCSVMPLDRSCHQHFGRRRDQLSTPASLLPRFSRASSCVCFD